jgi:sugar phosphate isomerase/epimerase
MEIGISTACFYPLYTENTIKIISDLESNLCEVFLEAEYEYEKDYISDLKKEMDKFNVRANSVHAFCATFEAQLFSEYERRRTDALVIYKKVVEAATRLGATSYTFHGDKRCDDLNKLDFKHYIKCVNELLDIAQSYNIALSWENVAWCQTSRPEFIAKVKDAAPTLKFTLDIKQARRAGKLPDEYLDVMGSDIINVHVNDFNNEKSCMLPGQGMFDFKSFFQKLNAIDYKGNAIIEVYSWDYDDYTELKTSIEYLRSIC